MWRLYMPDNAALAKHYRVPARADDLAELPPSLVVTAGGNPLRDEGLEYGLRLAVAGVDALCHHYPRAFHVFDLAAPAANVSRRALDEQFAFLRAVPCAGGARTAGRMLPRRGWR
jgi:acetyl esterase